MTNRISKPLKYAGCLALICGLMSVTGSFADEESGPLLIKIQAQSIKIDELSRQADKILQDQQQIATELEQIRYWIR